MYNMGVCVIVYESRVLINLFVCFSLTCKYWPYWVLDNENEVVGLFFVEKAWSMKPYHFIF